MDNKLAEYAWAYVLGGAWMIVLALLLPATGFGKDASVWAITLGGSLMSNGGRGFLARRRERHRPDVHRLPRYPD